MKQGVVLNISIYLMILGICYSQELPKKRAAFDLYLPITKKEVYTQKIQETPYFHRRGVLELYATEHIFVEVDRVGDEIRGMNVVDQNLNPEKTLVINLNQETKNGFSNVMVLSVSNPFKDSLHFQSKIKVVGNKGWRTIPITPVKGHEVGYEMWNKPVISIRLYDWTFR